MSNLYNLPTNNLRIVNLELARFVGLEASLLLQYFFNTQNQNIFYYDFIEIMRYTEFDYDLIIKCLKRLKKEKFIFSYKFKNDTNIVVRINYNFIQSVLGE